MKGRKNSTALCSPHLPEESTQQGTSQFLISLLVLLALMLAPTLCLAVDYGGYRPHYQGYGTNTVGGRGGTVYVVNSLEDDWYNCLPGTLRYAVERMSGPRIVVFAVSGTIHLDASAPLDINNPYLTIAGQTAPSPGINIRNWGININTHDVVIQHIRMRMGDTDATAGSDQIFNINQTGDAYNVVLDHCSAAWTMDMCLRAYPYSTNLSLLDCIFAYPLDRRQQTGSPVFSGYGAGMGHVGATIENAHYTYMRNLFVHSSYRSPILGCGQQQVINNVTYGSGPFNSSADPYGASDEWAFQMLWSNTHSEPSHTAFINTYTIDSNGTGSSYTLGSTPAEKTFNFRLEPWHATDPDEQIYLAGNKGPGITNGGATLQDQKNGIYWKGTNYASANIWPTSAPSWAVQNDYAPYAAFDILTADEAVPYVLASAGARPLDRDWVDTAAVAQAQAGYDDSLDGDDDASYLSSMGRRLQSQNDMANPGGGWGHWDLPVNSWNIEAAMPAPAIRSLPDPADPYGRTYMETWLEAKALEVEGGAPPGGDPEMTSPIPGSTLPGSSVTFQWTPNGTSVEYWWLRVGTSPGAGDIYWCGTEIPGDILSQLVTGIPTDGSTIYVGLEYYSGGQWYEPLNYTYTAYSGPVTLMTDGFETNPFTAPARWTKGGNVPAGVVWYTGSPKIGTHSVQFKGAAASTPSLNDALIQRIVNTTGYSNIQVSFQMGANSLDSASELMQAWWSADGGVSDWHLLAEINGTQDDNQLHPYGPFTLPAAAENNPNFLLVFDVRGNAANDYGYVDDVLVTGQ